VSRQARRRTSSTRWASWPRSSLGFCNGPLRDDPRRVGKPLGRELAGYFSARRGAYRVICRLVERDSAVYVVRIEHRADAYRRRWSRTSSSSRSRSWPESPCPVSSSSARRA